METEDQDEAYHSGLGMISASGEGFGEDDQLSEPPGDGGAKQKDPGLHPATATQPKLRSEMNKLFSGKRSSSALAKGPGPSIKPTLTSLMDPSSAITPTSHLTGQLKDFKFAETPKPNVDSPTSDYVSADFPSLCESDHGYTSMPSMADEGGSQQPTSLPPEKPRLITSESHSGDEMEVDRATSKPSEEPVMINEPSSIGSSKIDISDVSSLVPSQDAKNTESATFPGKSLTASSSRESEEKSHTPPPVSMLVSSASSSSRSESPVLHIGENIEVMTDSASGRALATTTAPPPSFASSSQRASPKRQRRQRQDGVASKRGRPEPDLGPSTKNIRLSPEDAIGLKKPIRVSTIVSPSVDYVSLLAPKKRGQGPVTITVGDHSSTPSPSHSPHPAPITSTQADASQVERVFHPGTATITLPLQLPSVTSGSALTTLKPLFTFIHKQPQAQQLPLQQKPQAPAKPQGPSKPPRVDFTDVQAMSISDRPSANRAQLITDNTVQPMDETMTSRGPPLVIRTTLERPKPSGSPIPVTSPMHVVNLISPHSSRPTSTSPARSRSLSPHSPSHSPNGRGSQQREEGAVVERGAVRSRGAENLPAEKQNALLKVTEAHLAILPDEDGDTPLHLAIIHENVPLTRYIIRLVKGVDTRLNLDMPNNMRQTPLHLAVITKQPEMVQMLLEHGASINYPDRKGNSAVHLAAARRDMKILQILSKCTSPSPDFNGKNFAGLTAVHVATKEANIDVLKFLFQVGANKNVMDSCSGRTALHYAVEAENFTLVNFLLESSCNVNAPTFAGNTPLHIAAGRRLKEIVALLMAYGANPALANGEGDFPSDLPASLLMQRAKLNAH